jgi:hypothetical protein
MSDSFPPQHSPAHLPSGALPDYGRAAQRRGGVDSCLIGLLGVLVTLALLMVVTGVVIARAGSLFDIHPFGWFSEPETTIDDRQTAVVVQMRAMARLETMTYTVEKVIEAEKSGNALQDVFFGDRILLIAHGDVVAGVDLGKLTARDVTVSDDNAVTVRLPASEILSARLDNDQTRVYDRDKGLLSRGDSQLETKARQAAEDAILQAACDQGILQQAADQARVQLEGILHLLDFERVVVIADPGQCEA